MSDAATDVATLLAGTITPLEPGGADVVLTLGSNLIVGPVRPVGGDITQLAVFVLGLPGQAPSPYLGQSVSWEVPRVQVTVRTDAEEWGRGWGLARALRARAHEHPPAGWTLLLAVESDPNYLGEQDNGAHLFVFNLDIGAAR